MRKQYFWEIPVDKIPIRFEPSWETANASDVHVHLFVTQEKFQEYQELRQKQSEENAIANELAFIKECPIYVLPRKDYEPRRRVELHLTDDQFNALTKLIPQEKAP